MKKLISIVFGTRPELIKLAPVILLAQQDARFNVEVILEMLLSPMAFASVDMM